MKKRTASPLESTKGLMKKRRNPKTWTFSTPLGHPLCTIRALTIRQARTMFIRNYPLVINYTMERCHA